MPVVRLAEHFVGQRAGGLQIAALQQGVLEAARSEAEAVEKRPVLEPAGHLPVDPEVLEPVGHLPLAAGRLPVDPEALLLVPHLVASQVVRLVAGVVASWPHLVPEVHQKVLLRLVLRRRGAYLAEAAVHQVQELLVCPVWARAWVKVLALLVLGEAVVSHRITQAVRLECLWEEAVAAPAFETLPCLQDRLQSVDVQSVCRPIAVRLAQIRVRWQKHDLRRCSFSPLFLLPGKQLLDRQKTHAPKVVFPPVFS